MTDLSIRKATPADVPLLCTLIREFAEYEHLSGEVHLDPANFSDELFERKRASALILEIDSKPVGYCLYFFNFSTFLGKAGLYIEDIYVRPTFRGKGMGKKVFDFMQKLAADENCGRVEWACLDWNETAISFYEKMGAQSLPDWMLFRLKL